MMLETYVYIKTDFDLKKTKQKNKKRVGLLGIQAHK